MDNPVQKMGRSKETEEKSRGRCGSRQNFLKIKFYGRGLRIGGQKRERK